MNTAIKTRALRVIFGVVFAAGCGQSEDFQPLIRFTVPLVDVIQESQADPQEQADGLPKAQTPSLTAQIVVPQSTVLRIDARISRNSDAGPGPAGPVDFRISVDDLVIFEREVVSEDRHETVTASIPLGRYAGEEVKFRLEMDDLGQNSTKSYWHRVTLERAETVSRQGTADGPNLLWVLVDTLRADHCSPYGYTRPTTPFLAEFARESILFERAVAPSSWTLPSVASLMTGVNPVAMTAVDGAAVHYRYDMFAEVLQRHGVTTFAASANPLIAGSHGFQDGFETFRHIPWEHGARITTEFERWLRKAKTYRWFAYLHYIDPHDPYEAPGHAGRAFVDPGYEGVFSRKESLNELYNTVNYGLPPAHEISDRDLDFLKASYDQEILYWDRQFEAVVTALERQGILENTIVVVTSDHGEEFKEHGMFKHGHQLFEESLWVPLVIRPVTRAGIGRRSERVELLHLRSTLLNLMGIATDGMNIIDDGGSQTAYAFTRYTVEPDDPHTRQDLLTAWDGKWKLIHDFDKNRTLLFDLLSDPKESNDLSIMKVEQTQTFVADLTRWFDENWRLRYSSESPPIPLETEDALRALGYIQ